MPSSPIPDLLGLVSRYHLLGTSQLRELAQELQSQYPGVHCPERFMLTEEPAPPAEDGPAPVADAPGLDALLGKLVERGWLTSYQSERLLRDGQGLLLGLISCWIGWARERRARSSRRGTAGSAASVL